MIADFVFCVLFLFCLSPCGVLCTQCCPFMIADLFSAFRFYFVCLRVVSCILNVANVSGCPFMIVADLVFCALFLFWFFFVLCLVYSMLSIHDCCRFCFLCFVFSLFVSVLCLVYLMLPMSLVVHSWLLPI